MEVELVHRFDKIVPRVSPHLEGPHWDDATNTLLYVDILMKGIHRWNPETKVNEGIKLDKTVGFAVPARKGGIIAGLGLEFSHVDWDSQSVTCLHEVKEASTSQINDGKCDPQGRVWAGTYGEMKDNNDLSTMEKVGHLYSIDVDGSLTDRLDKIGISNGLAWTPDARTMYFIDSLPRKVYAFDYDINDGSIKNQRTVVEFQGPKNEMGLPDGMAIDTEGKIWIASFFASKVFRFDPETGKELQSITLPAKRVTSCCFGGKNHDELYVTTSVMGADEAEMKSMPLSGSIFRVTGLGVKDKTVGFAVPARKGGIIAGLGLKFAHVDWDSQNVTCLHEVNEAPTSQINDGKCDPKGRVWAGTYGEMKDGNDLSTMETVGHLYSIDLDGSLTDRLDKIGISNGLAWTQDARTMYFIDSLPRKVYAFDYNINNGSIKNQRTVVEFKGPMNEMGNPDGMAIDTEGKIWIASFFGGKVFRFDPETVLSKLTKT